MENLWLQLNAVITDYETSTATKREQYGFLKEHDDVNQAEISQFPKTYKKLRETAETLRENLITVAQERNEIIEDLAQQSELLTKKVFHLRQQAKVDQTMDEIQLKQLSVVSSETIKVCNLKNYWFIHHKHVIEYIVGKKKLFLFAGFAKDP